LDTTFPVDVERRAGDLDPVMADDDDLAIAAVTVAELLAGVALAGARQRPARQALVDDVLEAMSVLAYDAEMADVHAALLVTTRQAARPVGPATSSSPR
jgi:tRNA(fMet)-specific endonuclease VapC